MTPKKRPSEKRLTPFAETARRIRMAKGLTQLQVARDGGLGRGYIAMLESGDRGGRPSRDSVLRVATGLAATPEERAALLKSAGFPVDALPDTFHFDLKDVILAQGDLTDQAKATLIQVYETLRLSSSAS